jgi:hypothetical protein
MPEEHNACSRNMTRSREAHARPGILITDRIACPGARTARTGKRWCKHAHSCSSGS